MVERDTVPLYTASVATVVRPQEQLQDLNAFGDHEALARIESWQWVQTPILAHVTCP